MGHKDKNKIRDKKDTKKLKNVFKCINNALKKKKKNG